MPIELALLHVEDSADDAALIVAQLRRDGFAPQYLRVETEAEMRAALRASAWDVILADYNVPGFGALPALQLLRETKLDIPFIVISGVIGEEAAIELMKSGAHDCLMKERLGRLAPTIRREIDDAKARRARVEAETALRASEKRFRGLIEQSLTGIYITQENVFKYANRRLLQLLGYEFDELVGMRLEEIVSAGDLPTLERQRANLAAGANSVAYDVLARRKDGSVFELGIQGSLYELEGAPATVGMAQDISEKKRAEAEIKRYVAQLKAAFMSTVEVATSLSEMRDPYTAGHERRVADIAVAIGGELGLDQQRLEGLRVAGHLHDVGKITIPAEILSKPGRLNPIEYRLIQGHAEAGYEVLRKVEFPWPVAEVALQHHERMDGSGYPRALKGEAILLESRIIAVADVIEAMSSHRPYRAGLGVDAAIEEIARGRGSRFDQSVTDAALALHRGNALFRPN